MSRFAWAIVVALILLGVAGAGSALLVPKISPSARYDTGDEARLREKLASLNKEWGNAIEAGDKKKAAAIKAERQEVIDALAARLKSSR